ncbi:MAG: hypothetical protein ACI4EH_07630 [Oliverpabstia sp.]
MSNIQKFLSELFCPSDEFTPVPFWFFNDRPDEQKIKEQLEDYVQKGIHGLVLHPRIGIPRDIPYLSEAYFDVVKYIVKTASNLNMKIVLYDEGMYPSGSAHGMVVELHPEYASRGIRIVDDPSEASVLTMLPNGRYMVRGFTGGNIRGIHFGEDDGELFAPKSADILNPESVKLFIHLTHERYYKELSEYFGNTIIGFFTDEPCALGRNSGDWKEWADGMEEEISAEGGRLEELEALFTGGDNITTQIYHRLVKKHLRETFYRPLSQWCESHGIALMGHPAESDDIEEEFYFHIPGQDLIMRRVEPKEGGITGKESVQGKLSADIARHLHRRRNASECFGVCYRKCQPWYFTGEDMKWYIDWLGMRGVNLFIPHAFYYSVEGIRKEERPPDVGPNNIWWKHYRKFSDYMKRMSFLMTDSYDEALVAVLCDDNQVPWEEVQFLYEHQIPFHYLPISMLKNCTVKDGKIYCGIYAYEAILKIPELKMEKSRLPIRMYESAKQIPEDMIISRRAKIIGSCKSLRLAHFYKNEMEMYLLSNEGRTEICFGMQIPCNSIPVLVNLWRGRCETETWEKTTFGFCTNLCIKPCETVLILLDKKGEIETERFIHRSIYSEDWTQRFRLIQKNKNQAVYEYTITDVKNVISDAFEVYGEEMAECYCNGKFVDVSFWNPHRFEIKDFLHKGENVIRVTMTGNAANIYADANINYGLNQ